MAADARKNPAAVAWLLAISLSLCSPFQLFAELQPASDAPLSLKQALEVLQGKNYYGNYAKGRKLGWDLEEFSLDTLNGESVAKLVTQSHTISLFDKTKSETRTKNTTWFSLEGQGLIVRAEAEHRENGDWKKRILRRDKGKYYLETLTQAGENTRPVLAPKETFALHRDFYSWLNQPRKKGDVIHSFSLSLEEDDFDVPSETRFMEKVVEKGSELVFLVEVQTHGAVLHARLKKDGKMIQGTVGRLFDTRLEPEKKALDMSFPPVDMLDVSAVTLDTKLGDPSRVSFLSLRPKPQIERIIPESTRQKWVKTPDGQYHLEIRREPAKGVEVVALKQGEKTRYLESTRSMPTDDPKIQELAEKITRDAKSPGEKARAVLTWVYKNLDKTLSKNADSAKEVLEAKAGDCTEHTLLFVALARAGGIPSREVGGIAYLFDLEETPRMGWHAWAEFHDGSRWVTADPTWNQICVDATHIKFSEGPADLKWINLLGGLKFQVLDFKKEKE